jgi:uncharacterized DUF497 family protein
MAITFDPAKRDETLAKRGLDFEDAEIVFAGVTLDVEDARKDYGESRMILLRILGQGGGSIMWIRCLRFTSAQPRVAQPDC